MQTISILSSAVCSPEATQLQAFGIESIGIDTTLLPANMRRRTSQATRLAITAATHACKRASIAAEQLPAVFASLGGEVQITDTLCRTLPDVQAALSPTQFHNSVHNTTAGYWSILNRCHQPSTAIAANDDTFVMGILEVWTQLQQSPGCVLLVCFDEIWPEYLSPPVGKVAFAAAFVLSSESDNLYPSLRLPEKTPHNSGLDAELLEFIGCSPTAACLPLLQALKAGLSHAQVPLNTQPGCWFTNLELPQ